MNNSHGLLALILLLAFAATSLAYQCVVRSDVLLPPSRELLCGWILQKASLGRKAFSTRLLDNCSCLSRPSFPVPLLPPQDDPPFNSIFILQFAHSTPFISPSMLYIPYLLLIPQEPPYTADLCWYNMSTREEWIAFSTNVNWVPPTQGTGTFVFQGRTTMVLYDFVTVPARVWYFNGRTYPSHGNLISALGLTAAYNAATRRWFRCDATVYVDSDGSLIFGLTINVGYAVDDALMLEILEATVRTMPMIHRERVAYVSIDPVNQKFTEQTRAIYKSKGMELWYLHELQSRGADVFFDGMYPGEAWGTLRLFPNADDTSNLLPTDIPVFNALPLELSVVSGVITTVYQTVNSHVNLKSNERDTPNMVIFNYRVYEQCFNEYNNTPVHLTVSPYGWVLQNTTHEEMRARYLAKVESREWMALFHERGGNCVSYDDMCPENDPAQCIEQKKRFGTKAAMLGFLRNRQVLGKASHKGTVSHSFGYDTSSTGFGVPFQYYLDFIHHPSNKHIYDMIMHLSQREMEVELLPEERKILVDTLKHAIWNAYLPVHIANDIRAISLRVFGDIKDIKIRSSSNAEDLPGFDGAGLYDSFPARTTTISNQECRYDHTIDEMVPDTVECAVKGSYASLWNQRAVEERTFARYRHDSAVMGIAVVSQYKELGVVTGNAVAVSRLLGHPEKPGYTFSVQSGTNDVTNPDPGTVSETTLAYIRPDLNYTWFIERYATPEPGGVPLTTRVIRDFLYDDMMILVLKSEEAYCLYKFGLSPEKCASIRRNNAKTALDSEFKFMGHRRVLMKQLREFSGAKQKFVKLPHVEGNKCQYISPAYFDIPDGNEKISNAAKGKDTRTSMGVPDPKGVDNTVAPNQYTAVRLNSGQWFEVDLGGPFFIRYIRIFPAEPAHNNLLTNFRLTFFRDTDGSGASQVFNVNRPFTNPVLVEYNLTEAYDRVRIQGNAGGSPNLAFTEIQVHALQAFLGDPNDFPVEPRPNTEPCEWSAWRSGSCITPEGGDPSTCGIGTGQRLVSRSGTWCRNYNIGQDSYFETCDLPCTSPPPPPPQDSSKSSDKSSADEGMPWWAWLLIAVGIVLVLGGIGFVVYWKMSHRGESYLEMVQPYNTY